ncbi:MAG: hypothetical protein ACREB5_12295, partial [Sphingomonadaceae bacterium]
MADKPKLNAAKATEAPAASEPVPGEQIVAAEAAGVPDDKAEALLPDDARGKLAQLFAHLKIAKIVFVDDKAELQTDAGAVIKVLAAKPEAGEALAPFFAGVALKLDNDALQEQLAARLAELDGDKLAELRAVLST